MGLNKKSVYVQPDDTVFYITLRLTLMATELIGK